MHNTKNVKALKKINSNSVSSSKIQSDLLTVPFVLVTVTSL